MTRGEAIIRYWGESHAVAVHPASLSLAAAQSRRLAVPARDEPTTRELSAEH
jgi:hypothetical protein